MIFAVLDRKNPPPIQEMHPLRAPPALGPEAFRTLRRSMMLDYCKWDPQVGDTATLAPFPLVLPRETWSELARAAECLAAEAAEAEAEILARPDLQKALAVPRAIRKLLQRTGAGSRETAPRCSRFDFHWTRDGWRISEMNSDVPGGLAESSIFPSLMAAYYPGCRPAGDPAGCYAAVVAQGASGPVALLSAPGYMEDLQVVSYLAGRLRAAGMDACLARPEQITWSDGLARLETGSGRLALGALVRFYQAEWLPSLKRRCAWELLLAGSRTPVSNPGSALLLESKRFPLIWDRLGAPLAAWKRFLPETRSLDRAPWRTDGSWIIKAAYSNNGDAVGLRSHLSTKAWRSLAFSARLAPRRWAAQRRFESVPVPTPAGPLHACVGIYAVNGRAAGAYGRLSAKPLIDFEAVDAAVLIEGGEEET